MSKKKETWKPKTKSFKATVHRIKLDMGKIKEDQRCIRDEQRDIRERFEDVNRQCDALRLETEAIVKQSALNRIRLVIMLNILEARQVGDFDKVALLTCFLNSVSNRRNK
uniref:Uncharacterized protein n=1 Tax=Gossypium raimondii TaxID=29730 RepID=A0A0D2VFC3_GOSRA|nr:hypothetical protein B456_013G144000 [Gossypium raimondii]